jgi:hypothetical protein
VTSHTIIITDLLRSIERKSLIIQARIGVFLFARAHRRLALPQRRRSAGRLLVSACS